jgi:hypothetical protein
MKFFNQNRIIVLVAVATKAITIPTARKRMTVHFVTARKVPSFITFHNKEHTIVITRGEKPKRKYFLNDRYQRQHHSRRRLIPFDSYDWLWSLYVRNDDTNDDDRHDNALYNKMIQQTNNTVRITTTKINNRENNKNKNDFDWDTFLDTPYFDPNSILNDPNNTNSIQQQLALWVQDDYHTIELILTGIYCILLIIITQELLRIQIYGIENYIPFTKGSASGHLF